MKVHGIEMKEKMNALSLNQPCKLKLMYLSQLIFLLGNFCFGVTLMYANKVETKPEIKN